MSQQDDDVVTSTASDDSDVSAGDQVKDTFSELGNASDNEGDASSEGAAAASPPREEPVRDWPPVHMDDDDQGLARD